MPRHPTHERLLQLIHYDPLTGIFTNLASRGGAVIGKILGGLHHTGYRHIRIDGRKFNASALAWFYVHKVWPVRMDHEDLDRANDKIGNLRPATSSQNGANRKACRNSTSGAKGVRWRERPGSRGVWVAQITKDGKVLHLGHFDADKKHLATAAYQEAAKRLHGEFARF